MHLLLLRLLWYILEATGGYQKVKKFPTSSSVHSGTTDMHQPQTRFLQGAFILVTKKKVHRMRMHVCVCDRAPMCDTMCGWMHMCLYQKKRKEKKKVPVILVCGSPQLTLSSGWGSSHTPPQPGTRREGRVSE